MTDTPTQTDTTAQSTVLTHRRRPLLLGTIVVVLLTLVSGAIHGKLSNRWAVAEELKDAGQLLDKTPADSIGTWDVSDSLKFSDDALKMLECTGQIGRVYVNHKTTESIQLFVIVGPRGPISVHTPDVCFSSRAYHQTGPAKHESVMLGDGVKETFWSTVFESRNELDPHRLIAWHGWSTGGDWSAPAYQRLAFLGSPRLYKIQLVCRVQSDEQKTAQTMRNFLRDFLPVVAHHMQ